MSSDDKPSARQRVMGRFRLRSVRWKIIGLIAVAVVSITGLDAWFVPERAADAERESLRQRANAGAAMLADSVKAAVEFEQQDSARDALGVARADPLFRWAAIYQPNGRLMTAVGQGSPEHLSNGGSDLEQSERIMAVATPIESDQGQIGWVALGIQSTAVAQRRQAARQTITMQGGLVGGACFILALLLSAPITRSISQMAEAAERIARGDVLKELELTATQDELGDMAVSFKHMNSRLRDLQRAATRVADGDLTIRIPGDGELYIAFQRMVDSLRDLTGRMGTSSDSVSSAAAGMFSSVREQQALATQQTAALEEIRRTLESLAVAAEAVAKDAAAVNDMSVRTLESSQRMTQQTRLVSAHSDRIGEILSLIQDIADRSDLLALNAALEGTKAGEVGRGFSLVAAEMRRLSEHVMDSVRDIRKLVADMRSASHSSVLATEESTKLAKEAASAAAKISEAVRRQQQGTSQAKAAADEIVRAVNDSLAGSAESTRSAESLLQLSHELKSTLKAFNIEADHDAKR